MNKIIEHLGITTIEYDSRGNTTAIKDVNDNLIKYAYGSLNELVQHTYNDDRIVEYQYNKDMLLETIKSDNKEIIYHYDNNGNIITKQVDDITSNYEYDNLHRLTKLSHYSKQQLIEEYQYEYDQASNMITLNKQRQNNDSGLFNYEYDSLNRLTQVSKDNNFISGYEYDGKNNRTKYITPNNITEYLYNDNSQLIKTVDNNSIKEYEYYLSGNVKQVIEDNKVIKEYKYNIDNRLIEAKSPKGVVAFSYNSLNKLVAKTSNQEKTDYIIDHLKPFNDVITSKTNKTSMDYLYDATGLVSENNDIALLDHLGTPTTLMNNNDITTQRTFNEFGISNDIQDNEIGYTGYLYDEVSQLNYAQARFYNPEDARFNGLDNIVNFDETPIGFNRYSYVGNDPMNYVDMDGNIKNPIGFSYTNRREKRFGNIYTYTDTTTTVDGKININSGSGKSVSSGGTDVAKNSVSRKMGKYGKFIVNSRGKIAIEVDTSIQSTNKNFSVTKGFGVESKKQIGAFQLYLYSIGVTAGSLVKAGFNKIGEKIGDIWNWAKSTLDDGFVVDGNFNTPSIAALLIVLVGSVIVGTTNVFSFFFGLITEKPYCITPNDAGCTL